MAYNFKEVLAMAYNFEEVLAMDYNLKKVELLFLLRGEAPVPGTSIKSSPIMYSLYHNPVANIHHLMLTCCITGVVAAVLGLEPSLK